MYDPSWYREKTIASAGEGVAAVAALIGFLTVKSRASRRASDEPSENIRVS
jgi:hypothetical protein